MNEWVSLVRSQLASHSVRCPPKCSQVHLKHWKTTAKGNQQCDTIGCAKWQIADGDLQPFRCQSTPIAYKQSERKRNTVFHLSLLPTAHLLTAGHCPDLLFSLLSKFVPMFGNSLDNWKIKFAFCFLPNFTTVIMMMLMSTVVVVVSAFITSQTAFPFDATDAAVVVAAGLFPSFCLNFFCHFLSFQNIFYFS